MAGDQNRNRIRAACAADGPDRLGFANRLRDFAVASRFAGSNFPQRVPDAFLKFRSRQIQRRKSFWRIAGENFLQGGFGGAMPAGDCIGRDGRDIALRCPDAAARRPYRWKIQFGQAFFRVTRNKSSGARGNGQFNEMAFHWDGV